MGIGTEGWREEHDMHFGLYTSLENSNFAVIQRQRPQCPVPNNVTFRTPPTIAGILTEGGPSA